MHDDNDALVADLAEAGRSPFEPGSDLAELESAAGPANMLAPRLAGLGVRLAAYVTTAGERAPVPELVAEVARQLRALDVAGIQRRLAEIEAALQRLEGN